MGLFKFLPKDDAEMRKVQLNYMDRCTKKMETYSKSLDQLNEHVEKLESMLLDQESKEHNKQLESVDFALDLKYLKEQGDLVSEQVTTVSQQQLKDIKKQLEVNHERMEELSQLVAEENSAKVMLQKKLISNNRWIKFAFFTQIVLLAGMIVMLLNMLDVIVL